VGRPQTVVHAAGLSVVDILTGLRQGRCYLAESAAVTLGLEARCYAAVAGPGQVTTVPADVRAQVSGAPGTRLALHTAGGVVARATVGATGRQTLSWVARDPAALFVRAEVRRTRWHRPMVALTNPIWLRPGELTP
jgi:hypothetical protein